ncbi:VanZ family protein [Rhodobacter sp. NTK016B]|uniref:VanZ family protein n=1 Tax=Rhodobacter sp. NTK016B TaxID=2759676 RepID=UPI001A8C0A28|nr:VanZ family protein [Rhodobacter sp. NTK016B]MBN8294471.1 VanZ family protein [Rhodobacter sp. NTK016B]
MQTLAVGQAWFWRVSGLVVSVVAALLIAALTLTPIPTQTTLANGLDKVYHFVAFVGLIFPLILTDSRRWPWAVPLCIAYGGLIELIQPTVGRAAEWLDFGADVTGVLAGAALAEILHDRIRDRFFAVDGLGEDEELSDEEAEAARVEAMRIDLMDELRVVLREELTTLKDEPNSDGAGFAEAPFAEDAASGDDDVPRNRPAAGDEASADEPVLRIVQPGQRH